MNTRKEFDRLYNKTTLSEEEFNDFKRVVTKLQLSLARKTATFYGITAITVLIALVYGFVTNAAMKKSNETILYYQQKATEAEVRITQLEAEIKASVSVADAARAEAEKLLSASQQKSRTSNSKK
jgi:hypothetical protein